MKTLLKIGMIVVLLIVVAVVVISSSLSSIIKAGVETVGPKITGTTMKLDGMDLSLFSGKGRLKGLVIGNPPGFQAERAFKLADTKLKGQALTIPLPDIHLRDIGKESGGVTVQKAAAEVFAALNKSVVQAVASSGKLLEKGIGAAGEAAKGLGSEAGKTVEGIKGLFGK